MKREDFKEIAALENLYKNFKIEIQISEKDYLGNDKG